MLTWTKSLKNMTNVHENPIPREIRTYCDEVKVLLELQGLRIPLDPLIHSFRSKALMFIKNSIKDEKISYDAINYIWKNMYIEVIKIGQRRMNASQTLYMDKLIKAFIVELMTLSVKVPIALGKINFYIGNLRQFSWTLFAKERDRILAALCYKKALEFECDDGSVLNHLGMLWEQTDSKRALIYYFFASRANSQCQQADSNIIRLLNKCQSNDLIFKMINHAIQFINSFEYRDLSGKWTEDLLPSDLDSHNVDNISVYVILLTLIATSSLIQDESSRCVFHTLIEGCDQIMTSLVDWKGSDLKKKYRRRCELDSDGEESENHREGEGRISNYVSEDSPSDDAAEYKTLFVAIVYFTIELYPYVFSGRSSLASRSDFEKHCRNLVKLLNMFAFKPADKDVPLWNVVEASPLLTVRHLVRSLLSLSDIGISYNGVYEFTWNNSHVVDVMKNMAKLRLTYEKKEVDYQASLPIYVIPEREVLYERLNIMKKILRKNSMILVLDYDIIINADEVKKVERRSRKLLRWVDKELSGNSKYLRLHKRGSTKAAMDGTEANTAYSTSMNLLTSLSSSSSSSASSSPARSPAPSSTPSLAPPNKAFPVVTSDVDTDVEASGLYRIAKDLLLSSANSTHSTIVTILYLSSNRYDGIEPKSKSISVEHVDRFAKRCHIRH